MEVACPKCKKRTPYEGNPYRPFCSKRCQLMDLGAWASEEYRVSSKESDPSSSENDGETSEESPETIQ